LTSWYILMPKTELVYYVFAAGLGFTWLATVPPTAATVGKLFGARSLATLFDLTLLFSPQGSAGARALNFHISAFFPNSIHY